MAAAEVLMRPLKRVKLGPPDCYPQDPKQPEDDLSESKLRRGFSNSPVVSNEHGSAKERFAQLPLSKFAVQYNRVLLHKQKINTFQDGSKKKVQINTKDNFWMVTNRSRSQVSQWFQDLAGNKSLTHLGKKVPIFNKKEEIFANLADYSISMIRAAWFLKVTAAYHNTISEGKIKKRINLDSSQEWTNSITKFLKEQLGKLLEFYNQPYSNMSMQRPPPETETAIKQWEYGIRLSGWLLESNLLEKHNFVSWIVDSVEKLRNNDDALLKHILPLTLKHLDLITQTQSLSRSLAANCIKKLLALNSSAEQMQSQKEQNQPGTPMEQSLQSTGGPGSVSAADSLPLRSESPVFPALAEFKSCEQHRSLVVMLCGIIQAILLKCPTALVWRNIKINNTPQMSDAKAAIFKGSPLDLLPCAPSSLFSFFVSNSDTFQEEDSQVLSQLQDVELEVQRRSQAVERRWLSPAHQETRYVSSKLTLLETLDKTNFNLSGSQCCVNTLYEKFFDKDPHEMTENIVVEDKSILTLLLNWAVSKKRHGKYRSVVVAKILLKRQMEIFSEAERRKAENPDDDSLTELGSQPFQNLLLDYLDHEAPMPKNPKNALQDESFEQLVLLFGELIRHECFSHDAYLCNLIKRGNVDHTSTTRLAKNDATQKASDAQHYGSNVQLGVNPGLINSSSHLGHFMDRDKQMIQDRYESPPDFSPPSSENTESGFQIAERLEDDEAVLRRRQATAHTLYVTHFPIPNIDFEDNHESNQRSIFLYGVGNARKKATQKLQLVETLMYEVMREVEDLRILISEYDSRLNKSELKGKKAHLEKKSKLFKKFSQLPRFDQYNVAAKSLMILGNLKRTRPSEYGVCSALPSVQQVSLVIDLFELANDVQGLVDLVTDFIYPREVGYVGIFPPQTKSVKGTMPNKLALVEAVIKKHYTIILTSAEQTMTIFKGLLQTVENIADPGVCSSTERCVLSSLYDLYVTCGHLKDRCSDIFSTACTKIKQSVRADVSPSNTSLLWETGILKEYLTAPRNMQLDPIWLRHLSDDRPADLYSFVCSAVLCVCKCQDAERLYDLSVLCTEVAAHISALNSEWLGVLKALCCASMHGLGFDDLQGTLDITSPLLQESLSTFTSILVARCVFSLEDCLKHVIIPSLSLALPNAPDHKNARFGARLTCHILLKLFDGSSEVYSSRHNPTNFSQFKSTPEHSLLIGSFHHLSFELLFYVLKLLIMIADSGTSSKGDNLPHDQDDNDEVFDLLFNQSTMSDPTSKSEALFEQSFAGGESVAGDLSIALSSLSAYVLQVICKQIWVQQRFVHEASKLYSKETPLDPSFPIKLARRLINLCSSNENELTVNESYTEATNRIFSNLDHWSLDFSSLELQLMIRQAPKEEVSLLFNEIARSVMSTLIDEGNESMISTSSEAENSKPQLVGPLIGKLPSTVQGRILKTAGEIMEKGKWWKNSGNSRLSPASQQTLFNLVLSCLKEQDDNKVAFLGSLQKQFSNLVMAPIEEKFPSGYDARLFLMEGLHLRLNLVGALFDVIQRSTSIISDWTQTLFQLSASGIIEEELSGPYSSMFTDVLDMVSVLLSTIQLMDMSGGSTQSTEVQKYWALIRKLQKDVALKEDSRLILKCKQLLPLEPPAYEVICMQPDDSQNGSSTPLNKDKANEVQHSQQGLKMRGIQHINPWDLLEDHKSVAPLSWAWFGASRIEKRPSRYLEQAKKLLLHTHQKRRPMSYYMDYELDDDVDEESDNEVKEPDRHSQPGTPNTPGGPPTPGNKSALAQLLASVQNTGDPRPATENIRQPKQNVAPQQTPQKRKRSTQRQDSQSGLQNTQGLTPNQQKKLRLLMQQQQPQQGSLSTGQIILGQQPLISGQGRQSISMTSTPDSTKEALQAMLVARNQQSAGSMSQSVVQNSIPQSSIPSVQSTQNAITQLQQQLALNRKQQQQQQQQQQLQMQSHQYEMVQQERQLQMSSQSQQQNLRMMQSQGPPNVQLPMNQGMSIRSCQSDLIYSNQVTQPLSTFAQANEMSQGVTQNLQGQSLMGSQYTPTNQRLSQGLQQTSQLDDTQTSLHQLLQMPMARSTISPVHQMRVQPTQSRSLYQQQAASQQQQQQQQQQRSSVMLNQLTRQYSGLQQGMHFQRQYSDPTARQLQEQPMQQQPDLSMYQRQISEPQGSLQQLQNMLPPRSQFLSSNQQYPPPGPF